MFTGIITGQGEVREIRPLGAGRDMRLVIAVPWADVATIPLGASIACSGCCLTVVSLGNDCFAAEVSAETLAKTTLGRWQVGTQVNLERALRMGDELGGHIVSGHVDAVGTAISAAPENGSTRWRLRAPPALAKLIAPKGSIAVDGVSLTVNDVADEADGGAVFGVNIIAHTTQVTSFALLRPGDPVNLEIDMLARYVARLVEA